MKLLKIDSNQGYFLDEMNDFTTIDKITKEDLLRLVDLILVEEAEFDEYNQEAIKNQAQNILYRNIYEKLKELSDRKAEFTDRAKRAHLTAYEKYREEPSQNGSN